MIEVAHGTELRYLIMKYAISFLMLLVFISCGTRSNAISNEPASETVCDSVSARRNLDASSLGVQMVSSSPSFVKTKAKCDKCSCSGYWGMKHANGTYEGNCRNTDQWGHKCGHSPSHHGLREY